VTEGYVPLDSGFGSELWVGEAAGEEEVRTSKPFQDGVMSTIEDLIAQVVVDLDTTDVNVTRIKQQVLDLQAVLARVKAALP